VVQKEFWAPGEVKAFPDVKDLTDSVNFMAGNLTGQVRKLPR